MGEVKNELIGIQHRVLAGGLFPLEEGQFDIFIQHLEERYGNDNTVNHWLCKVREKRQHDPLTAMDYLHKIILHVNGRGIRVPNPDARDHFVTRRRN